MLFLNSTDLHLHPFAGDGNQNLTHLAQFEPNWDQNGNQFRTFGESTNVCIIVPSFNRTKIAADLLGGVR